MKFIVLDVGNTSTAVGLWSGGRVSNVSHIDGSMTEAMDAVAALAHRGVHGIAYLSVVPRVDGKWRAFAKRHGMRFHQISSGDFSIADLGLSLDYPKPETIGADRLADAGELTPLEYLDVRDEIMEFELADVDWRRDVALAVAELERFKVNRQ